MGVMGVMEHEVADSHTETTARSEQPQCVRETEGVESGGAGEVGTELAAGMPAETGNEEKRGQNHVVTSAPETKADDEEFDDEEQHWDRYGFFIDGRSSLDIRPCVEHKAPSAENSAEKTHPDKIDTPRGGRHSQNRVWDKYMEQLSDHGKITRTRELRHLVRRGVPENLRGKLWLAIVDCSSVRSQYHARYYEELLSGSAFQEKTQASWEIDKDLSRTFPRHRMFSTPSASSALRRVLVAFSVHKPHVGYCQSLNLLAATMLLFVNEEQAFWLLTTVLSDLLPDKYYSDGMQGCLMDQQCLRQLLSERLPSVDKTFQRLEADWQVVTMQWFLCLHVTCLPFESALRVWDVFLYDGAPALFRVALALFQLAKPSLASASNATQALQALQDVAQTVPDPDALIAVAFGDRKCKVVSGDMARLRHRFGPADAKGMPLSPQTRAKSGGGGSRQETPGRSDALPARASPESAPVAAPGSPRAAVGTQRSLLGQLARAGDDDGGAAGMRELSLAGGEAEAEAEGGGGKPRVLFKVPSFYTQVPDGGLGEVEIFDSYLAASPSAGGADEGAGEGRFGEEEEESEGRRGGDGGEREGAGGEGEGGYSADAEECVVAEDEEQRGGRRVGAWGRAQRRVAAVEEGGDGSEDVDGEGDEMSTLGGTEGGEERQEGEGEGEEEGGEPGARGGRAGEEAGRGVGPGHWTWWGRPAQGGAANQRGEEREAGGKGHGSEDDRAEACKRGGGARQHEGEEAVGTPRGASGRPAWWRGSQDGRPGSQNRAEAAGRPWMAGGGRGRRGKKSLSYDDVPSMQQGQRLAGGGGRADLADDSASEVGALPAGWITKGSHMASDVQVVEDYLTGDPKPPIAMADYVMGGGEIARKGGAVAAEALAGASRTAQAAVPRAELL